MEAGWESKFFWESRKCREIRAARKLQIGKVPKMYQGHEHIPQAVGSCPSLTRTTGGRKQIKPKKVSRLW